MSQSDKLAAENCIILCKILFGFRTISPLCSTFLSPCDIPFIIVFAWRTISENDNISLQRTSTKTTDSVNEKIPRMSMLHSQECQCSTPRMSMLHSQESQWYIPKNFNLRQKCKWLPRGFAVAVAFCRLLSIGVCFCRFLSMFVGLCRYANVSSPAQPRLSFGRRFCRFVSAFVDWCLLLSNSAGR